MKSHPRSNDTGALHLLPHPAQAAFIEAKRMRLPNGQRAFDRFGVFSGRRGGKTMVGGLGVADEVTVPRSLGWACAPSYPELQDYVIPAVFQCIPEDWIDDWVASRFLLKLKNGAECVFRSLDDPERGRGPGLDWLWIDEARKIAKKAWDTISPALADKPGIAWTTTSPNGQDWCVLQGTEVLTYEMGHRPIESLHVGHHVWTRQGWKPITHVTYMGLKPIVTVEAGPHRVTCTADHKIATLHGWCEAGALIPRTSRRTPALAATTLAALYTGVCCIVGMSLRTMRALKLCLHPRGTQNVLPMRDSLQVVGVDAGAIPAEMVDFQPSSDRTLRQTIGESMRSLFSVTPTNPSNPNQTVPDIGASSVRGPRPVPTTVWGLDTTFGNPLNPQIRPFEVSRVSHGSMMPVWDIGVKDAHEFLAGGILVHNCYNTFWVPARDGEAGYWAVKYKTSDNPKISAREIERAKRELDPLFFQQEYEGDFVSFTGAVYGTMLDTQILKDHVRIKQVLPEFPDLDKSRSAIIGMDPGADHPFAAVLLVATEAGLVQVGEHLKRNTTAADHAIAMRAMCRGLTVDRWAIDRSARQVGIELSQHGIYATAVNNDVVAGIQRVQSWLGARRLWFIQPWCPKTVEQLQNYQWDENVATDGQARRERVKKIMDDLPDALRYATMLWPELPSMLDRDPDSAVDRFTRELRDVPETSRWQVERMRRISYEARGEDLSELDEMLTPVDNGTQQGTGDFYA